jgi:hypothetical protein
VARVGAPQDPLDRFDDSSASLDDPLEDIGEQGVPF